MNTNTAVLSQPLSLLFFKQQSSYHSGGVLSSFMLYIQAVTGLHKTCKVTVYAGKTLYLRYSGWRGVFKFVTLTEVKWLLLMLDCHTPLLV